MIGTTYGRLTVVATEGAGIGAKSKWRCLCTCGNEKIARGDHLRNGVSRSCGCLARETASIGNRTHGESMSTGYTKEYRAWQAMLARCRNPNVKLYSRYGGRGITVCQRWEDSYETFLADMKRAPTPKHSLDRIDFNGNYEPNNCRWATSGLQRRNASHVVTVEVEGEAMCLKDACAKMGRSYKIVHGRIRRGWTIADALATPKATSWSRHRRAA